VIKDVDEEVNSLGVVQYMNEETIVVEMAMEAGTNWLEFSGYHFCFQSITSNITCSSY
jgi:hypothetical protein